MQVSIHKLSDLFKYLAVILCVPIFEIHLWHDFLRCFLVNRGLLLQEEKRFEEAVESYQRAVQYRPKLAGKLLI